MSFVPKTWADGAAGGTPVSAAELQRMESGIVQAHAHWKLPINRQVMVPQWFNANAQMPVSAREYAWPLLLGATGQAFDQLGMITSSTATDTSATFRVGLRADNNGIPGTLLAETTEYGPSVTASSSAYVSTLGTPIAITDFLFWLTLRTTFSTASPFFAAGNLWQMPGGQLAAMLASSYGTPPAAGHGNGMLFYQTSVTDRTSLGSSFTPANSSTNSYTGSPPVFVLRRSS